MKIYKVKIEIPGRELEFRIKCTSFSTAASRAIREMRKHVKGKRLKELSLRIFYLGAEEDAQPDLWPTEQDIETAPDFQTV